MRCAVCSNLPRTSGAKCGGNLEASAAFEHGDDVVDGDSLEQPKASGSDVDCALGVVERIGLIGAAGSELLRQLRSILCREQVPARPKPNRSPNVLCFPGCFVSQANALKSAASTAAMGSRKSFGFQTESQGYSTVTR